MPAEFHIDDSMIEPPLDEAQATKAQVLRGRTIVVPEAPPALQKKLDGQVLLKCGDKITTDHIMPAGTFLKLRSNVPEYAKVVFNCFNEPGSPTFAERALALKSKGIAGIIVAGESYGQGSSREHAALCPMYLGVRAVIAKTIERIHRANLINFCIVPIRFADPADYDRLEAGDALVIDDLIGAVRNAQTVRVARPSDGFQFVGNLELSSRDREVLLTAGLLSYTREKAHA
jgi:aconitate hydratase